MLWVRKKLETEILWWEKCAFFFGETYIGSRAEGRWAVVVLLCNLLGQPQSISCQSPVRSFSHSKTEVTSFTPSCIWVAHWYKLLQIWTWPFNSRGGIYDTWCLLHQAASANNVMMSVCLESNGKTVSNLWK